MQLYPGWGHCQGNYWCTCGIDTLSHTQTHTCVHTDPYTLLRIFLSVKSGLRSFARDSEPITGILLL